MQVWDHALYKYSRNDDTSKLQTLTKFHVFLLITTQLRIFYQNEFGKHQIVHYLLIYHVKDMLDFVL